MCCRPLCTAMVRPIKSGKIVDRRDQVLMGLLSFFAVAASTFFNKWRSQNGPFLIERDIHYPCLFSLTFFIAALHNHRRCAFVAACTITFGRCPPRADRIASIRCFAFSAAMRMIHWIHCNALHCRTFFFFNDTATTEIYTLSLHDALPI